MKKFTVAATLITTLFAGSVFAADKTTTGQLHFTTGNAGVEQACSVQVVDKVGSIQFAGSTSDPDTAKVKVFTNVADTKVELTTDSISDEVALPLNTIAYNVNGTAAADATIGTAVVGADGTEFTIFATTTKKPYEVDMTKVYSMESTVTCRATL